MEKYETPTKNTPPALAWTRPYLCMQCHSKITNEEYIVSVDHQFYDVTQITNCTLAHMDESRGNIVSCVEAFCKTCGTALGFKLEINDWLLYKEKVVPSEGAIKVTFLSLKKEECEASMEFISEMHRNAIEILEVEKELPTTALPPLKPIMITLTKSGLRNAEYHVPPSHLAILIHKCEGRILLTDRNGLYHDLLLSAKKITRNEKPALENELYNEDIETLATEGGQPSLLFYKSSGSILVWDTEPNAFQRRRIAEVLLNSYYQNTPSPIKTSLTPKQSPLSKTLRKAKIERVYTYYNQPENNWEVREWAQQWRKKQSTGFLNCALL